MNKTTTIYGLRPYNLYDVINLDGSVVSNGQPLLIENCLTYRIETEKLVRYIVHGEGIELIDHLLKLRDKKYCIIIQGRYIRSRNWYLMVCPFDIYYELIILM